MLKTFKGFKGKVVFGQIGDCKFVIMAETPAQLAGLWNAIMGIRLDPSGISNAILVEAATLPAKAERRAPCAPVHVDALDRLNATLAEESQTSPIRPTSPIPPTIEV